MCTLSTYVKIKFILKIKYNLINFVRWIERWEQSLYKQMPNAIEMCFPSSFYFSESKGWKGIFDYLSYILIWVSKLNILFVNSILFLNVVTWKGHKVLKIFDIYLSNRVKVFKDSFIKIRKIVNIIKYALKIFNFHS